MTDATLDTSTVQALSERLEAYASTLSEREQQALRTIIWLALDPIDRLALEADDDGFTDSEVAILRQIDAKSRSS